MEKIKVGIVIENQAELKVLVNGERLHDYTAYFTDKFYDIIQSSIEHDNWAVWFKQFDEVTPKFIVDIYVNDTNDWVLISKIISDNMDKDPVLDIKPRYWDYNFYCQELK